jgi:hypothetical protein
VRDLHPKAGTDSLLLTDWVLKCLDHSQALIFLRFRNLWEELLFNIFSIHLLLFHHLTPCIHSVFFLLLLLLIINGDLFICPRLESRIIKKILLSHLFPLELFKVLEPLLLSQLLIFTSVFLKLFFRHWLLAGFDLLKFLFALFSNLSLVLLVEFLFPFLVEKAAAMLFRVPAGASSTIPLRDPRHGAGGAKNYWRIRVSLADGSFLLDIKHPDAMALLITYLLQLYQFLLILLFLQPHADLIALVINLGPFPFFFCQFSLQLPDF